MKIGMIGAGQIGGTLTRALLLPLVLAMTLSVIACNKPSAESTPPRKSNMNKPEFFVTPGYGERNLRLFHYSQAVKIGNRLEISGQGGWNNDWEFPESITDEIAQAFRNVERTLAVASAGWKHVIHVNSYHVGLDGHQKEINQAMSEQFRHYMPDHAPVWTCLGVAALGDPKMRVEIRVTAILPE